MQALPAFDALVPKPGIACLFVSQPLQPAKLLLRPFQSPQSLELVEQMIVQGKEVPHVFQRIGNLLGRERPLRPVGECFGFVQSDADDLLHKRGVPDLGPISHHRRRDLRVENGRRHRPRQHRENFQVLPPGMHDFVDAGVAEEVKKMVELGHRLMVNDGGQVPRRDLDDFKAWMERILTDEFRVHRQALVILKPLTEGLQAGLVFDVRGFRVLLRHSDIIYETRGGKRQRAARESGNGALTKGLWTGRSICAGRAW